MSCLSPMSFQPPLLSLFHFRQALTSPQHRLELLVLPQPLSWEIFPRSTKRAGEGQAQSRLALAIRAVSLTALIRWRPRLALSKDLFRRRISRGVLSSRISNRVRRRLQLDGNKLHLLKPLLSRLRNMNSSRELTTTCWLRRSSAKPDSM